MENPADRRWWGQKPHAKMTENFNNSLRRAGESMRYEDRQARSTRHRTAMRFDAIMQHMSALAASRIRYAGLRPSLTPPIPANSEIAKGKNLRKDLTCGSS